MKFNLINLGKGDSLYNHGMKVLVLSETEERTQGKGWVRDCDEILYHPNSMFKTGSSKPLYTVTFTHTFMHTKDTVYFAYSQPYTYTDLMKFLLQLENDTIRNNYFSRKLLCNSIGGNRCDYLSITGSEIPEYMKNRKGVVFSARAHPGESVGSWMMHGVIDFLTGDSQEAAIIRENFVVKVIPMINPDGVINGNYRTNLAGNDLNRKWKQPCKVLQPTIYHAKRLIKSFSKERKLELICDLHGHSRRMNTFMYGCNIENDPAATRTFPLIISKLTQDFRFKSCSFHMQRSKESTLRISMFKEVAIPFVYTLEASFCGGDRGHYTVQDLMDMGKQLCLALLIHTDAPGIPKEMSGVVSKEEVLAELHENKELLEDNNDTSGSESEPSEDNLDQEILKILLPKPTKKKKKKQKLSYREKKSVSPMKKRESLPIRTDRKSNFDDRRFGNIKKCLDCGELDIPNHFCLKKIKHNLSPSPIIYKKKERPLPSSLTSLASYVNVKGKNVRDQATQTMYIRKQNYSEMKRAHSLSLIPAPEREASQIKFNLDCVIDTKKLKEVVQYDEISLPHLKYQRVGRFWSPDKLKKIS